MKSAATFVKFNLDMIPWKDMVIRMGPAIKKAVVGASELLVKEAVSRAGQKAAESLKKGPEKIDSYIDQKKKEAIKEARGEAEAFAGEQMEVFEKRVDCKLDEIERRIDEKINRFYRGLIFVIIGAGFFSGLIFLFFGYLKRLFFNTS